MGRLNWTKIGLKQDEGGVEKRALSMFELTKIGLKPIHPGVAALVASV